MSAELIAILTIGVTLAGWPTRGCLARSVGSSRTDGKLEGLLEGLREAISGRRVPTDAA